VKLTTSPPVTIQAHDDTSLATVNDQFADIKTLSGKGVRNVQVLGKDSGRPAGCVAYPVSTGASVFLYVKGRVDLDAEIEKAQKKLDKTRNTITKQKKILADPAYLGKVSTAVQDTDRQKLEGLESEARSFEGTIQQFEQLKLE
jgi:valyl-tRNA synthetase